MSKVSTKETISDLWAAVKDRSIPVKFLTKAEYDILDDAKKNADVLYILSSFDDLETFFMVYKKREMVSSGNVKYIFNNQSLLDNCYFPKPVNQRGQTEYTGQTYTIDRWARRGNNSNVLTSLTANGIKISGPSNDQIDGGFQDFTQRFEDYHSLLGKTLTASILLDDFENVDRVVFGLYSSNSVFTSTTLLGNGTAREGHKLFSTTIKVPDEISSAHSGINFCIRPYMLNGQGHFTLVSAKLELGAQQTLAHQDTNGNWVLNDPPPNQALELEKCQRYYQVFPGTNSAYAVVGVGTVYSVGETNRFQINIPIPTPMRTLPNGHITGNWFVRGGGGTHGFSSGSVTVAVHQYSTGCVTMDFSIPGDFSIPNNFAVELVRFNNTSGKITLDSDL